MTVSSTVTSTQPAWGIGLATVTADEQVLDTWFPTGKLGLGELPLVAGEDQADVLDLPPAAVGDRAAARPAYRRRWSP